MAEKAIKRFIFPLIVFAPNAVFCLLSSLKYDRRKYFGESNFTRHLKSTSVGKSSSEKQGKKIIHSWQVWSRHVFTYPIVPQGPKVFQTYHPFPRLVPISWRPSGNRNWPHYIFPPSLFLGFTGFIIRPFVCWSDYANRVVPLGNITASKFPNQSLIEFLYSVEPD